MRTGGFIVNSWFRVGTVAANVLVINLLWVACSLPLITLLPSTAALFGSIRHWSETGEESVFSVYFSQWRRHVRKSYVIGGPALFVSLTLEYESAYYLHRHGPISLIMLALVLSRLLVFLLTSVYLWPLMVSLNVPARAIWKTAFVLGIRLCPRSLAAVLPLWFLATILIICVPISLFAGVVPVTIWLTYLSNRKGINQLNARSMS